MVCRCKSKFPSVIMQMIRANHRIQCACTSQNIKVCRYTSKMQSVSVQVKIWKLVCTSQNFKVCLHESYIIHTRILKCVCTSHVTFLNVYSIIKAEPSCRISRENNGHLQCRNKGGDRCVNASFLHTGALENRAFPPKKFYRICRENNGTSIVVVKAASAVWMPSWSSPVCESMRSFSAKEPCD